MAYKTYQRWLQLFIGLILFLPLTSHADSLDTWVRRNPSPIPGDYYQAITCGKVNGNDLFVAAGMNILTSSDGVTWSIQTLGFDYDYISSITYGNGTFVAMGSLYNLGTYKPLLLTSTDGNTWIPKTIDTTYNFDFINYCNNSFLAFGYDNSGNYASLTSTNGIDWTLTELGTSLSSIPKELPTERNMLLLQAIASS